MTSKSNSKSYQHNAFSVDMRSSSSTALAADLIDKAISRSNYEASTPDLNETESLKYASIPDIQTVPPEEDSMISLDKYLDQRFANIDQKVGHIEEKLSLATAEITSKIDANIQQTTQLVQILTSQVQSLDQVVHTAHSRIDNVKFWIIGTAIALLLGIFGIIKSFADEKYVLIQKDLKIFNMEYKSILEKIQEETKHALNIQKNDTEAAINKLRSQGNEQKAAAPAQKQ